MFERLLRIFWRLEKSPSSIYRSIFVYDPPELLNENEIYVVGTKKYPWKLTFLCPCGCREQIHLNLLRDIRPRWKFKLERGKRISISPSVWRTLGCRSHFCIHSGRVKWVHDYYIND